MNTGPRISFMETDYDGEIHITVGEQLWVKIYSSLEFAAASAAAHSFITQVEVMEILTVELPTRWSKLIEVDEKALAALGFHAVALDVGKGSDAPLKAASPPEGESH